MFWMWWFRFGSRLLTSPAYWTSGYFGVDEPGRMKLFRSAQVVTDPPITQGPIELTANLIDYDNYRFGNPDEISLGEIDQAYVPVAKKARLLSWRIDFTRADIDCGVMELATSHFPLSDR